MWLSPLDGCLKKLILRLEFQFTNKLLIDYGAYRTQIAPKILCFKMARKENMLYGTERA